MSKSVKKIVKNSFFQTIGAFGVTGLNFVLMLGYARILGPEHFGSLITSQAQVIVWSLLVDLGLSNGLIGALTAAHGDKSELSRQGFRSRDLLARVLLLRLCGALVGSLAILLLACLHGKHSSHEQFLQDISFIPFLFALGLQQTAIAYSNFRERQGLAVLSMLLGIFTTVVLSLFLALHGFPIRWLLLSQSWGGFLTAIILFTYFYFDSSAVPEETPFRRIEKTRHGPWRGEAWKALGQDAWPYAITFAAGVLWQRLDQITASHFLGLEAAGQYALAVRLVAIPVLIASSVSFAIFPDLQRVGRHSPDKIIHYLGAISKFLYRYGIFMAGILLLVVAFVIAPLVPKFGPALKLLPWFIPGVWAFWIHSFIVNALFGLRKYKDVVVAHLFALAAYIIVLPITTKFLGLVGVAWGYNTFSLVLLAFCLTKLRATQLVGKRFSLFAPFTAAESEILNQLKDRLFHMALKRRE